MEERHLSKHGIYDSSFYAGRRERVKGSARMLVPLIHQMFQPRSVIDVGCGHGEWLHEFESLGVTDILGIDGKHIDLAEIEIPIAAFRGCDLVRLEVDQVGRTYDLALCLEMAEHLPGSAAAHLVLALTSLAKVVIFSAAVPG